MPQVQNGTKRKFHPEDFCERDWHPRVCIKITWLHKSWLRTLFQELMKARVNAGQDTITLQIDEEDFMMLSEILHHFDNYRFIKSSIEPLVQYGGADNPDYHRSTLANPFPKKNLQ